MNLCILQTQLIGSPKEFIIQSNISLFEILIQIPNLKNKISSNEFKVYVWEDKIKRIIETLRIGDFIIIEGVLSFSSFNTSPNSQKELILTVYNISPINIF
jgi:PIN domain nuclease of toxin-antitoxin system